MKSVTHKQLLLEMTNFPTPQTGVINNNLEALTGKILDDITQRRVLNFPNDDVMAVDYASVSTGIMNLGDALSMAHISRLNYTPHSGSGYLTTGATATGDMYDATCHSINNLSLGSIYSLDSQIHLDRGIFFEASNEEVKLNVGSKSFSLTEDQIYGMIGILEASLNQDYPENKSITIKNKDE